MYEAVTPEISFVCVEVALNLCHTGGNYRNFGANPNVSPTPKSWTLTGLGLICMKLFLDWPI